MDLSTIQMHLDNFVNTWEGWGKVFEGLANINGGVKDNVEEFGTLIARSFTTLSSLSSK